MERPVETLHDEMIRRLVDEGYLVIRRVEDAFRTVRRDFFLPSVPLEVVYSGQAVITRRGPDGAPTSSSSMPAIMAVMLEQLDVQPGQRVLEIGAGTGYNAALLAVLAQSNGEITTIDIDADIVREARQHLNTAGHHGVRTVVGDGWVGVPEHAPYDRIEATVGVWDLSPFWVAQLVNDGLVVIPLWLGPGVQVSVAFRKNGERLRSVTVRPCGFMRLRGPHAGPENYANVNGWTVSLNGPDPARLSLLASLLKTEPRVEQTPHVPKGWGMRLALEDPRTIYLSRTDNWRDASYGTLDVLHQSLALICDNAIYTFGTDAARDILLGRLETSRPLELRWLTIEAITSTAPTGADVGTVIRRPHFQFMIEGGA